MSALDPQSFRAAMARFPGAVTIVTALHGTERRGITATAVCSVSATWRQDQSGLPVLADAVTRFSCAVSEQIDAGSHTIFIGQITGLSETDGAALIYQQRQFHRLTPL